MKTLNLPLYAFFFLLVTSILQNVIAIESKDSESELKRLRTIHNMIKDFPTKLQYAPTLSSKGAFDLIEKGNIIFVDVRKDKEIKVSMIKGAISEDEFSANIKKYKDNIIIPYCTIGYRSALYTLDLVKKGMKAYNLEGGMLLWAFAGYKVYTNSNEETFNIHVYGKKWDLLPDNYNGIY